MVMKRIFKKKEIYMKELVTWCKKVGFGNAECPHEVIKGVLKTEANVRADHPTQDNIKPWC
jgi:hypothetical protein